ncbi:hypothetical protein BDN71DRAFT_1433078 [Pleurotus eryngii]|uniref:Uncharacterized protein n=1 Tax=Pleurotus eryngii TaxID=5323 RepID=A0A9P5ZQV2_PLEER|nr:hypothetical protein BDN71DRAFT_1433078 [Pleurotus eryngii]
MASEFTMVKNTNPPKPNKASYVIYWSGGDFNIAQSIIRKKDSATLCGAGHSARPVKASIMEVRRTMLTILTMEVDGNWQFVACTRKIKVSMPGIDNSNEMWEDSIKLQDEP